MRKFLWIGVLFLLCAALVGAAMGVGSALPADVVAYSATGGVNDGFDIYAHHIGVGRNLRANLTRSIGNDLDAAWSPDGTRLAYQSDRGGVPGLYVLDLTTDTLTHYPQAGEYITRPAWSPDGETVAYSVNFGTVLHLRIINLNTGVVESLTHGETLNGTPTWSPDGSQIAYLSNAVQPYNNLFVMDADGRNVRQITDLDSMIISAAWSPDGMQIALQVQDAGNYQIVTVNVETGDMTQITQRFANAHPAWTPDGRIIFESNREINWEIYTMDADGDNLRRITRTPYAETRSAWRP